MHLHSLGDLPDVVAKVLDEDLGLVNAVVDLLKSPIDLLELPIDLLETPVDLLETPVDLFETPVDLLETPVDLLESFVDLSEPCFHTFGECFQAVLDDRCQLLNFHYPEGTSVQVTSQSFYSEWNPISFRYFGSSASISPSPSIRTI